MAALASIFAEQTTNQTTTSTSFVDVTGATLSNASFTAGKKYLLIVCAAVHHATSTATMGVQVIHGSTAFTDSGGSIRPSSFRVQYAWFDVWTAVSSEDVKVQFKVEASGTAHIDQVVMIAIKLSDDLTENTDWFYATREDDDAITTTGVDGASVTFTPGGASTWLVLTYAQHLMTSASLSCGSQMVRSGEASSSLPNTAVESPSGEEFFPFLLARAFALTAASNTFKEQSIAVTTDNGTRVNSKVFALNLGKFDRSVNEYTEGAAALSDTDYATQAETASITPSVQGDFLIMAYTTFDKNAAGREFEFRLQVDDADQPDTQTSDNYQFYGGRDGRDKAPHFIFTRENLTAAAHTIDLDCSADSTTSTPEAEETSIIAFSLELAAVAGGFVRSPRGLDAGMHEMRGGMQ